jgi:hypothetical protein
MMEETMLYERGLRDADVQSRAGRRLSMQKGKSVAHGHDDGEGSNDRRGLCTAPPPRKTAQTISQCYSKRSKRRYSSASSLQAYA